MKIFLRISSLSTLLVLGSVLSGCGAKEFLIDALNEATLQSGDILVVSGGTVASTVTPFPLHQIAAYTSDGRFKRIVYKESVTTSQLMGLTIDFGGSQLLFTVDTTDRVNRISFSNPNQLLSPLLNGAVNGTTLRSVASLSDGGTLIAESTTVLEKLDTNGNQVTTGGFPITVGANLMKVRRISGDRFVIVYTGGNDSPSVRANAGTAITTIASGLACGTNCDPSDIVELPDGRFVISYTSTAAQGLHLYSSSFAYIGVLYQNTAVLPAPYTMTVAHDGGVIACTLTLSTCEKFQVIGNSGTRVGSSALIDDASIMRQPTDIAVIP